MMYKSAEMIKAGEGYAPTSKNPLILIGTRKNSLMSGRSLIL
jgi:hypothetical protein